MSKKDLVKKTIDDLIKGGMDFADLTQTMLAEAQGLKGVSKTTIKRAKKEYKQEKLANKRDYKEQSVKRKIYKYLDRRPRSSLADLREAMPGIHPSKVSEYHLFWKKKQEKTKQDKVEPKSRVSPRKLKEMVFNFLDGDNTASLELLYKQFPDAKQSSINSYFAGWKRKQKNTERAIRGGLYEVIFKYLDGKPEASLHDIKKDFSDVPLKSIEIYHNLWLKEKEESKASAVSLDDVVQEFIEIGANTPGAPKINENQDLNGIDRPKKRRGRPPRAVTRNITIPETAIAADSGNRATRSSLTEKVAHIAADTAADLHQNELHLVQTMQKTIEAHNTTIFELEKEYRLLMEKQSNVIKELEALPREQILEIRDFIVTYFKGLQRA